MEKQAKDMLASQAKRLEDYPEHQERAKRHEIETDEQIARLERCLMRLGDSLTARLTFLFGREQP